MTIATNAFVDLKDQLLVWRAHSILDECTMGKYFWVGGVKVPRLWIHRLEFTAAQCEEFSDRRTQRVLEGNFKILFFFIERCKLFSFQKKC